MRKTSADSPRAGMPGRVHRFRVVLVKRKKRVRARERRGDEDLATPNCRLMFRRIAMLSQRTIYSRNAPEVG